MTRILVGKLLRDVRLALLIVAVLLAAFQCLWAKITQRIIAELLPEFQKLIPLAELARILFAGQGKLVQTLMGGESIRLESALDMLSIGYVHPLMQTILCIWAIGRAAGAIAGEIDRGTMELLLAQPLARYRVVLAQLCVDLIAIPILCWAIWGGTWLGTGLVGMLQIGVPSARFETHVDPWVFGPALLNIAALLFAVGGYTMWLSALGRFRGRVMGLAVLVTLVQFLVNVIGQLWDVAEPWRPLTVFYYYQPQQIILHDNWRVLVTMPWQNAGQGYAVNVIVVLAAVGAAGYGLALWTFCRRDLPAPL
jgi:ABC-2 type transport system permease protein